MGKSKKRSRVSAARTNPLGRDAALVSKRIHPLLDKLKSVVPNERSLALSSITVLCEDPHLRQLLLKEKLVHIVLSSLLTDENTEIVVESYGLLRNLALEEGYDVSTYLWRSDIWVGVENGFGKLQESLGALMSRDEENNKKSQQSKRLLFDFADNLISLIVALCNGSDDILASVLQQDKLDKIFETITYILQYGISKIPLTLFNTILDFIYDFSSESTAFIDAVMQNNQMSQFVSQLPNLDQRSTNELSNVLIQGIFLQFLDLNAVLTHANGILHTVCDSVRDVDIKSLQEGLSSVIQDEELVKSDDVKVASKINDYTKKKNNAMMQIQAIDIAIDIITAITELIAAACETHSKQKATVPEDLLQTLTVFLPNIFNSLFSADFVSRTLTAWNNLLWLYLSLHINAFSLPSNPIESLWAYISKLKDNAEPSILLGKMSILWALLKTMSIQESPTSVLSQLQLANNVEFVKEIISVYQTHATVPTNEESQEMLQRCCGVLASYAAFPNQIECNRIIGKFLLDQLISDKTPIPILLVVCTFFFEIYNDMAYDYDEPVFVQEGFLNILRDKVAPQLKSRFKMIDKNKEPELKERSIETINILKSFIQYKEQER